MVLFVLKGLMHVLGATFDDGGNFVMEDYIDENGLEHPAYDDLHNDYQLISYYGVYFISNFRTAIGDI